MVAGAAAVVEVKATGWDVAGSARARARAAAETAEESLVALVAVVVDRRWPPREGTGVDLEWAAAVGGWAAMAVPWAAAGYWCQC